MRGQISGLAGAFLVYALAGICLLGWQCSRPRSSQDGLFVFAAASTFQALTELGAIYEREQGVRIRFSFASSAVLARQIAAGAPAGLFLSANSLWMDYLERRNLIVNRKDLLGNRLALVVPAGRGFLARRERGFDLAGAFQGRLSLGAFGYAPVGIYGREALEALGWWESIRPRIVQGTDARAVLNFVNRGEVAAGVVYATDVALADNVRIVGVFPADSHAAIVYPLAIVRDTPVSRDLYAFLTSGKAASGVFEKYGFVYRGR